MWSSSRPGVAIRTSTPRVSLTVLVAERDAADQERDVEFLAGAVFVELFLDLGGEFAGRLQDEGAGHPCPGAALFQHGEHRQDEGSGLAGAGLGDAENVAAGQNVRDRLFLNGGRGGVAGGRNCGEHLVGQDRDGKKTLSLWSTPPFGIEGNRLSRSTPKRRALKSSGALTYADERLTLGNRVSIQGRVEPEHRREMAKVNLGTRQMSRKSLMFSHK